jgi:hypothetical protein
MDNSSLINFLLKDNVSKSYAPHEPDEPVMSAEDAFADADRSEARWRAFEREQRLRRVLVELPEPAFLALEQVAARQKQTVARLVGQVMTELADVFAPSSGFAGLWQRAGVGADGVSRAAGASILRAGTFCAFDCSQRMVTSAL